MSAGAKGDDDGSPPSDLIDLGVVRGAYGVRGWVRIAPLADGDALLATSDWWLREGARQRRVAAVQARRHGSAVVAKWPGCETKEAADALKGATVAAARSTFPALGIGEHYLSDLIGCRVVNRGGEALGTVTGTRSSEVAGVERQWLEVSDGSSMFLLPLVAQYVDEIDRAAGLVRVDWQREWT